MKIDLHVHTIETKLGDGVRRKIANQQEFKDLMKNANVGIVAITNHNMFDVDQFKELKDENYLLLPGVEFDAKFDDCKVQLNVIYDPSKAETFSDNVKKITAKPAPYEIKEIIELFDTKNTIFFVDYKNTASRTAWKPEQIRKFETLEIKGVVLVDANNSNTHNILMAHDFKSLIGSDVQNWDLYLQNDVPRLIDTPWNITSYEKFCSFLKYGDNSAFKELSSQRKTLIPKTDFEIKDGKISHKIKGIEIFEGVNVIFGPKATGKSKLLLEIHNKNIANSVLYDSNNKEEYIEQLQKPNEILLDDDKNEIETIEKIMEEIKNYKESTFNKFGDLCRSFDSNQIIKIQTTLIKNCLQPDNRNIDCIRENLIEALTKLPLVFQNEVEKQTAEDFASSISLILNALWKKWVNANKEWRAYNLKNNITKNISEIIRKNKGIASKPNSIGLYEKWSNRDELISNLNKLKILKFERERIISEFKIPDRGNVKLVEKIITVPFGEKMDKNIDIPGVTKTTYNDKIFKLFSITHSTSPENLIPGISEYLIANKLYGKKRFFLDGTNTATLSNGEKSYISLMNKLSEDKKYFCLDEPGTYLGSEMISKYFLTKIAELKKLGKCIIITTHLGSIGLNSIPINMIFRSNVGAKDYDTYIGNILDGHFKETSSGKQLKFHETVVNNFEGGMKHFEFRKGIYENNN